MVDMKYCPKTKRECKKRVDVFFTTLIGMVDINTRHLSLIIHNNASQWSFKLVQHLQYCLKHERVTKILLQNNK